MNSKNNLEMNNKIEICNEGKKAYDIVLRDSFADLLDQMEFLEIEKKKVCIVTESNVAPIYLKEVCELISSKASKTITFSFEAGEKHKQLKTIEALYEELIINHFDRQDLLIALGGGVVGDMTGYAAATYLRGIDFVQVPTTLLSQVDSSIGGKTGVDFLQYKNMVGAFHQPKLVYINTTTLKSLPEREYFSGMGEVIKHGLIKDADYYEWIKENIDAIKAREHEAVKEMIYQSCLIKGGVVERAETNRILIRKKDGNLDEYKLSKFVRSNQGTCMNQRPIVTKGDEVETGQVIADGPSTSGGEIALGKNPLIGFMTWEGYNYEDAVLLSERLVQEDVYTSVHINEYETEARDTKLGPEEITRDG